jgi:ubiquinone/menaquinone biosynthesis C-methylase UbiE
LISAQNGYDVTGIDISRTALRIARAKAATAKVNIGFLNESFVDLPFGDGRFDFVWDMIRFHQVTVQERGKFITGVHRVIKPNGGYMLTCFSYHNEPDWNHFTKQQLINLFDDYLIFGEFRHYHSIEGDDAIRFFHKVLMKPK